MKYTEDEPIYEYGDTRDNALHVEALAKRLSSNYSALLISLIVAQQPGATRLLPHASEWVAIQRKGSTDKHGFDAAYALAKVPGIVDDFKRAYMTDAIVLLADALRARSYFEHDPALEMVYHLRNGLAHGNTFHFDNGGKERLRKHPAHTRDTWRGGGDKVEYEITTDLQGQPVLFEYMLDGDVLDLINEVMVCMRKKATGLPIKPSDLR